MRGKSALRLPWMRGAVAVPRLIVHAPVGRGLLHIRVSALLRIKISTLEVWDKSSWLVKQIKKNRAPVR